MPVIVSFFTPRGPAVSAPLVGNVRAKETVALDGTTTGATEEGEMIMVSNCSTADIMIATGTTPLAATTTATSTSSAAVGIPAGCALALSPSEGSKVQVKAAA